jgi:hypothetical protein
MSCGINLTVPDYADATQAVADLDLAYTATSTSNQPGGATLPGDIGGYTIYPGVYTSGGTLLIGAGNGIVTLDGNGVTNPVFIFQIASSLTTLAGSVGVPGSQIVLKGTATAANVYWNTGSTTLGTYSIFQGNILSSAAIVIDTGATLTGRALCSTAGLTLDTDTITMP